MVWKSTEALDLSLFCVSLHHMWFISCSQVVQKFRSQGCAGCHMALLIRGRSLLKKKFYTDSVSVMLKLTATSIVIII